VRHYQGRPGLGHRREWQFLAGKGQTTSHPQPHRNLKRDAQGNEQGFEECDKEGEIPKFKT